MNTHIWSILGFMLMLFTASITFSAIRDKAYIAQKKAPSLEWNELVAGVIIIFLGFILRLCFLNDFQGGIFTSDEQLISVIYSSAITHHEPARNGATHLGYALALNWWYSLFGFSALSARCFSATLGIIGLASFMILVWKTLSLRPALWATAFSSISLFGIYFSKLSLETGWVLFFPPCIGLLLVIAKERYSLANAIAAGVIFSFAIFSYPGILLATCVFIASTGLVLLYRFIKTPSFHFF